MTINTVVCGPPETNRPTMVLVHGYGGSGALFYKVIKQLSEKFKLILMDLIGMGGSGRPGDFKEDKFSPEETVQYFVSYMERWRVAMKLDKFFLEILHYKNNKNEIALHLSVKANNI